MDSPFWSQSTVPAFSISKEGQVVGINPAMKAILRFPGSFTEGRNLDLWLGSDLGQEIRAWIDHFLSPAPVPFPIQSDIFLQPIVLTEAFSWEQDIIIKGLPVQEQEETESAPDAERDAFLLALGKSFSHDLRAPLRHLNIMTQRLLKPDAELPESIASDLELITGFTSTAYAQATTLSDILKEEAMPLPSEEVDLEFLLQIVSGTFEQSLLKRGGELTCDPMPGVIGNKSALQSLLQELLSNAIMHVPGGRKPLIVISRTDTPEYTEILFTDNGIGLPQHHEEFLFQFMSQIHRDLQGIEPGMGLGLVRYKRIAQRMGMELLAGKQPKEGATFRLRIPSSLVTG